ncbi:ATP-dependent zinc metalloprotease FtsH [Synechococcus sp. PCC 7336]|uniref:ATP-dependent zinc metalloprotease FtsH n=1 Tax=Synechococcus sp. PCC 7336 TaxID=195250 RepID=UPI0006874899|nr:ATP-dependent zinc metalloprotease FtsH [Synechococcus sp. PCC 7336]
MTSDRNRDRTTQSPEFGGFGSNLITLFLILLLIGSLVPRPSVRNQISYSQFLDRVEAGLVERAEVGSDSIAFTLKPQGEEEAGQTFITVPVASDTDLTDLLRQHNVEFSGIPPQRGGGFGALLQWLLPALFFIGLWLWIFSRAQQAGGGAAPLAFGKSRARIYSEGSTGVTFNDVAGVDEAKEELQELVSFLKDAEKYTRLGAKIPKGVLLVGPPGTGKTLLARAIAGEAGVPFFSISGAEFIELFVGVGASRVRDLFEQAKRQAPCIVFIDELDALGKSRANVGSPMGGHDEREQTLNQLLAELDGFDPNSGVILLAATNRPEVLDPALLRPGRFNRQVLVDRPERTGRLAILEVHARGVKLAPDIDLSKIAARTPGFAGADLANLINEAALLAARKDRAVVEMADFGEALERILAGLEKKSRILNEQEQKTVAYHEVGHAIVGTLMPGLGTVEKISVVPRGAAALGYTLQLPEEDRFLVGEDEIRGRLAMLMGGRAAEELAFHKVSTGASDDIQKATDLAERYVTLYGMSQKLGPVAFEKSQQSFLEGYVNPRRSVSPKVAEDIDLEVKQLLDSAHQVALSVLALNRSLLDNTAQLLLQREVLEGTDLKQELGRTRAPADLEPWLQTGQLSIEPNLSRSLAIPNSTRPRVESR